MPRLSHEKHLQYCRWYYSQNKERIKQQTLLNYYRQKEILNKKKIELKL